MSGFTNTAILAAIATAALVQPAHAYLDPGTGSILLQAILGGIAGGLFIIRMQWARLKRFFGTFGGKTPSGDLPD